MHGQDRGTARLLGACALAVLLLGCDKRPPAGEGDADAVRPGDLAQPAAGDPGSVRLLDLHGNEVRPLTELPPQIQVYLFSRTDCPIGNRYVPEMNRIAQTYRDRGVAFRLVYPDPGEAVELIQTHLQEYRLTLPALRDPRHHLVRYVGATVTPEAAVFDQAGRLVYRGRIDDRAVDFGKQRIEASQHDLIDALDAALAGESPSETVITRAVGCYIESEPIRE